MGMQDERKPETLVPGPQPHISLLRFIIAPRDVLSRIATSLNLTAGSLVVVLLSAGCCSWNEGDNKSTVRVDSYCEHVC